MSEIAGYVQVTQKEYDKIYSEYLEARKLNLTNREKEFIENYMKHKPWYRKPYTEEEAKIVYDTPNQYGYSPRGGDENRGSKWYRLGNDFFGNRMNKLLLVDATLWNIIRNYYK